MVALAGTDTMLRSSMTGGRRESSLETALRRALDIRFKRISDLRTLGVKVRDCAAPGKGSHRSERAVPSLEQLVGRSLNGML